MVSRILIAVYLLLCFLYLNFAGDGVENMGRGLLALVTAWLGTDLVKNYSDSSALPSGVGEKISPSKYLYAVVCIVVFLFMVKLLIPDYVGGLGGELFLGLAAIFSSWITGRKLHTIAARKGPCVENVDKELVPSGQIS